MTREAKLIAAVFALSAFAVAELAGMLAGNSASTVLAHAIVAMCVCQVVGLVIGMIATEAIAQHVNEYRKSHPIADMNAIVIQPEESSQAASPEIAFETAQPEEKKK